MPRTTGTKNLPRSVQREIALDALRGKSGYRIAKDRGITDSAVYRLRDEALRDPAGSIREAEEELAFRRRVLEILDGEAD